MFWFFIPAVTGVNWVSEQQKTWKKSVHFISFNYQIYQYVVLLNCKIPISLFSSNKKVTMFYDIFKRLSVISDKIDPISIRWRIFRLRTCSKSKVYSPIAVSMYLSLNSVSPPKLYSVSTQTYLLIQSIFKFCFLLSPIVACQHLPLLTSFIKFLEQQLISIFAGLSWWKLHYQIRFRSSCRSFFILVFPSIYHLSQSATSFRLYHECSYRSLYEFVIVHEFPL